MKRLFVIIVAFVLVACSGGASEATVSGPCDADNLSSTLTPLTDALTRYEAFDATAQENGGQNTPQSLADIRGLAREVEAFDLPDCATEAQAALVAVVDARADILQATLTNQDLETVEGMIQTQRNARANYDVIVASLNTAAGVEQE